MQRIVYSVYVDVPAEEHYGQSKLKYDTPEKASVTVNAFKKHYQKLIDSKKKYAKDTFKNATLSDDDIQSALDNQEGEGDTNTVWDD